MGQKSSFILHFENHQICQTEKLAKNEEKISLHFKKLN